MWYGQALHLTCTPHIEIIRHNTRSWLSRPHRAKEKALQICPFSERPCESLDTSLSYAQLRLNHIAIIGGQNSEGVQTNVTSGPMHDAESIPKLYSNPEMLGFLTHARTVTTRLSPPPPPESLGTRLGTS